VNDDTVYTSRAAKYYWAVLFAVGTTLSIVVNAAWALGVIPAKGTIPAAVVAMGPPSMLGALVEGYYLARRSVPANVLKMVNVSVLLLGGSSFAVSYTVIARFINRAPG
jgi:hypothetical protein